MFRSRLLRSGSLRLAVTMSVVASLGSVACKSEIDGKPKAEVAEIKPTDAAKPDAPTDAAKPEEKAADPAGAKALALDTAQSKVGFVGAKVTGDHTGHFSQLSGKLSAVDGKPTVMEVEVATTSVESDDEKLTAHLRSPDFFDVDKYPTAKFVAKTFADAPGEGTTHTVTGELELHGVKKEVSFPANIEISDTGAKGKAEFTINRKDFGIEYPGKPDDLIKDEVLLKLDLAFS